MSEHQCYFCGLDFDNVDYVNLKIEHSAMRVAPGLKLSESQDTSEYRKYCLVCWEFEQEKFFGPEPSCLEGDR